MRFLLSALTAVMLSFSGQAFAQTDEMIAPENVLMIELDNGGTVVIEMFSDVAPQHVERFRTLSSEGFYDGVIFHRVIEDFMAQGGDPTGTGRGGSQYSDLPAEFSAIPHSRGIASMARSSEPNSANSQFFIMLADRPGGWTQLDGQYTVWGRVIEGMEYIDQINMGEPPAIPTQIIRARTLAVELPDSVGLPSPGPVPGRAAASQGRSEAFDPLFDTDVDIDILTPVLANPNQR